ncbi:DUF1572 domain-containing protein [Abyssalbus ytuae]|uniref:DUF1572 domain-containing protein n=1 Tax=Abyssalbus ytuae TaxID=2926907 RepID=A0A9E7D274_9FLAO|nr:DUF1572 domain-containing protein [Abyssalbus ytuae]UOB17858.1 DUF1572 domain-containing protein [Abyssalbus ytuae]
MKKSVQLANRIREVLLNGVWIANTNYKQELSVVDWETAITKINNLNSVATLTYHINYYLAGILNFFEEGKLEISDKYSYEMPAIHSQEEWDTLRNTMFNNARKFADQVALMDDEKLEEVFADKKYGTYLRNIEGVIEHSYYHLGQIVLIKKLIVQDKQV